MKLVRMKLGTCYVGLLFTLASFWLASPTVGQDKSANPPDKSADKAPRVCVPSASRCSMWMF